MGFLASVFGPSQSVSDSSHWLLRMIGGGKTKAGVQVSEFNALHYPVVYACMNRIANPVSLFPLGILQKNASGGSDPVTQHPMSERLGLRPNDFMSSRTFRKTVQTHALSWASGYSEIERNNAGQAVGLWPLLPWNTQPDHDADARLIFRTNIAGEQYKLDGDNVIHVMDQSRDGYRGLSPIAQARQAIGMGLAMEEFGAKFFANDAKSGGFLMHPGKLGGAAVSNIGGGSADQRAGGRYREESQKRDPSNPGSRLDAQGGLDNAHRVKVLEEGMKFVATTIPPEDAQFLGSRLFQIAEIARIYDVPLILLQSHDGNTSWGTGIEQLMIGFVRQTIAPWVNAWEQEFNWKLFTKAEREHGLYVKFNMNAWLRGDSAARSAFYKALFEMAGLTANQICAYEDMNGFGPDGDKRFVSTNVQALDDALAPPPAPAPAPPPVVEPTTTTRPVKNPTRSTKPMKSAA